MNDTAVDYPRDRSVHRLIETQAKSTPRAIAAQFGDEQLDYQSLDRRANQLANVLRERLKTTDKTGQLVGVSVERSLDMLVALIAVMKAGCAYVPLDPMHPAARLRYILDEAQVAALISDGSENASLVGDGTPVVDVHRDAAAIDAASTAAPDLKVSADSLAYVIYTSGSTGKPKGVEIPHSAVVNLLTSMARTKPLLIDLNGQKRRGTYPRVLIPMHSHATSVPLPKAFRCKRPVGLAGRNCGAWSRGRWNHGRTE